MINFNIGDFLYNTFDMFVSFFKSLYGLLGASISLPNFLVNLINSIFPSLSVPSSISILGLFAVTGVPIALAIGIYYIFKGPV